ncbi:hypothetical protein AZE42_10952 [Rhizopogon vesiculosus]|uniref:Uncharacterized protein n=1 Tax=Rhizopogon vesiculosus TaxID=180088 RepID=A0A1J8PK82_9AGAM|nr:hypothetical protein AZE42_10952 [Rhizopogon vesiculosus]
MSTSHPAQTTVRRGLASTGPMPMNFNRVNSPHTPNISQFTVPPTHFLPHSYATSSSQLEEGLPYRGQAVTQGQSLASTLSYHLSSPSNYPQTNAAVAEMAGNAMRLENTNPSSYFAPAGTPYDSTQVASPMTMSPSHAYSAPNLHHNSGSLRNTPYYDPTQANTTSWVYVPAMGSSSQLSYSPPMLSSNICTPDGSQQQWQSSASYYPPRADVLRSQPDVLTTSMSPTGRRVNATAPEMAGNAMRLENTKTSYFAPAGTPDDSTQVASPVTMSPSCAYSAPNLHHNSSSLRNTSYYDPTQVSTASWVYVPAMGNNSQLSDSPPMQSSNVRTPHGSQQRADVLHSQPDVPTTPTSPPGRSRGDPSRSHTHASRPCQWLGCVFEGSINELKAHFISNHLTGPQGAPVECLWDGCHYFRRGQPGVRTMRRDSTWRHILEIHLRVKYRKKVQDT